MDVATWLKTLTPKQTLQTLPLVLLQIKAGNTSEKLLNEIRQTIYSFYWQKEVYNNKINSIELQNRVDTIFVNSENSKASDLHRLLLNLSDEINLKRSDKYVALSNLSIYFAQKNIKKSYKNNKFKILTPT